MNIRIYVILFSLVDSVALTKIIDFYKIIKKNSKKKASSSGKI
jgi:hypothetical protein